VKSARWESSRRVEPDALPVQVLVLGYRLHQMRELISGAESLGEHGDTDEVILQFGTAHWIVDRSVHQAGRDRHYTDPDRSEITRQRQRHSNDAALAGAVGRLTYLTVVCGQGSRHDDHSALAGFTGLVGGHDTGGLTSEVVGADQIDLDNPPVGLEIRG